MLSDRAKALRPEIQSAFDAGGLDAVCELFSQLEARVEQLVARVQELEKRLNMNSSNSSKPLSSDGLKRKTKSLRRKNTGRKPGGQPSHPGQTLQQSPAPDITHSIALDRCPDCGADLCDEPVASEEKRQVFDIPLIAMKVSEHRAECKWCPACAKWITAPFPAEVSAPVQYGHGMQSVMSYLNIAQLLPCERTAEVCQDLFGHRPSAASVVCAVARCAEKVAPAVERIAGVLREAKQLHADDARQRGQKHIAKTTLKPLLADYDLWISKGLKSHPEVAKPAGKRGRAKQSKERNLLMRMSKMRDEVLRFAQDLNVPFEITKPSATCA